MSIPLTASKNPSVFLATLHHAYARTDGTYAFPNSREGDLLKQAKREVEAAAALRSALDALYRRFHAYPELIPDWSSPRHAMVKAYEAAMASVHALIKEGDTQAAIDHARRALGLPVS